MMQSDALPGRVGDYEVFYSRPLGHGTYGSVCHGKNINNGTEVAVKRVGILRTDPRREDLMKFIDRELKSLQSIKHPNIIEFLYHQKVDNPGDLYTHTFFILELCKTDLQAFAQGTSDFEALKMQVMEDVACALDRLHSRPKGVIHRDIKPENVLLKLDNGRWIAKVTDFGLSREVPGDARSASLSGGLGIMMKKIASFLRPAHQNKLQLLGTFLIIL